MINQKRKQKLLLPGFPGMNYKKKPRFCDTFFMRKNDIDIRQTSAKNLLCFNRAQDKPLSCS